MPPLVGVNLPWLKGAYGHDLGPNQAQPDWPCAYDSRSAGEVLKFLNTIGIRVVRFWLFEQGEGLVYDREGWITGVHPVFLANLCDFVETLDRTGFQVYWTLLDANSVLRNGDELTQSILVNPERAESFCANALNQVLPVIASTAWAIDLCNEVEAIIARGTGNGTAFGSTWNEVISPVTAIASCIQASVPGAAIGLGSGYHEHKNYTAECYRPFQPYLAFIDFHTYLPDDRLEPASTIRASWGLETRVVLGEFGCRVSERRRHSRRQWLSSQQHLSRKLQHLATSSYDAAFLWYLSDPNTQDATSLLFEGESGPALDTLRELFAEERLRAK